MSDDDFVPESGAKKRPGLSLKARAVSFLSQREHSRAELTNKLRVHCDDPAQIEKLLDDLAAAGWQSDARFAQGLVHRKAGIHGNMRIVQALKAQGISDQQIADIKQQLKGTEYERALGVWEKRFGRAGLPSDAADYSKQGRFLAARGFSSEVIHKILKSRSQEGDMA